MQKLSSFRGKTKNRPKKSLTWFFHAALQLIKNITKFSSEAHITEIKIYIHDSPHFLSTFSPAWSVCPLVTCPPEHLWYPFIKSKILGRLSSYICKYYGYGNKNVETELSQVARVLHQYCRGHELI